VRELERLLGRKAMEVELLKEALERAGKETDVAVALVAVRRYPLKTIAETLGVVRSNLIERRHDATPKCGPQDRPGDPDLSADIRRLVDMRPTYGYRKSMALRYRPPLPRSILRSMRSLSMSLTLRHETSATRRPVP
jgi:putative transposase